MDLLAGSRRNQYGIMLSILVSTLEINIRIIDTYGSLFSLLQLMQGHEEPKVHVAHHHQDERDRS